MNSLIDRDSIKRIDWADFLKLKDGDVVYVAVGDSVCKSRLVGRPFYNVDADESDWEVETNNGFCDAYSLYVNA